MSSPELSQTEADALLAMEKIRSEDEIHEFPEQGGSIRLPLTCKEKREQFMLDVTRGRIELKKASFQNRSRQTIILVRLDIFGAPHRNPDGEEVPCPHIHLYREGFADKWAAPIDPLIFTNVDSQWDTLMEFMEFCKIVDPPKIQAGLFT